MQNTSTVTCTLDGYPGIQLYTTAGQPAPTTVTRGDTTPSPPGALVTLTPGGDASFSIQYAEGTGLSNPICPTEAVGITPPNDTAQVRLNTTITPCYQTGLEAQGALIVTAIVPGALHGP